MKRASIKIRKGKTNRVERNVNDLLKRTCEIASEYLAGVSDRPVARPVDFPDLLARFGPPPQVIWVTCGNTSNARMRQIFEVLFPQALLLLQGGDALVEITDLP